MQILSNLLENAKKFTTDGEIEFGYTIEKQKSLSKKKFIRFFVKDSGLGIEEHNLRLIFDRFSQADNEFSRSVSGTGLGLAIAKELVSLLGGDIWVESEFGKGTTFYFTIPYISTKNQKEIIGENELDFKDLSDFTILIAEDDQSNIIYIQEILEDFNTITALNGEEAIDIAKNNQIDLILMDIKMPKINGFEAFVEIKKHKPKLPIIAQTAFAMAEDQKRAQEVGFEGFITKPIEEKLLFEIINKYSKNA